MPARSLDTYIHLPPQSSSSMMAHKILRLVLVDFTWLEPRRYGGASPSIPIDPQHLDLAQLVEHYVEHGSLCVAAKTDRDFIWLSPALQGAPPYTGKLIWVTSAASARKASWRSAHLEQVFKVMSLICSPLAFAALVEDVDRKKRRMVDRGTHHEEVPTVRGCDEGLAGLFWRNFYGPPFVRLFGDRLNALPPECVARLGEELVLVQPYELPTDAGTEAARAREHHLISLLGPECFYDHEHHRPPTRLPVLPPAPWPLPGS